ncbi:hypothetical protein HNQ93_004236 [Hymenobacter luteus]|uniref:Uncharacterized protein n=2 Tax=Hymenobacter TaxID=89966 RepID=A0A7W9WF35_9BACT|nr:MULTISPECIES: hypothetical protein [Hymenobacter]MBB4603609.1 hypothetical protein [Hymenobacter latericoloratus]MBB6061357.1 hypothetical protein [Hymenobacter luteus]
MASYKQKILRTTYPLIMRLSKSGSNGMVLQHTQPVPAPVSFYELAGQLNSRQPLPFAQFKGKQVLLW